MNTTPWILFGDDPDDPFGGVMVCTSTHDDLCEFFHNEIHTVKTPREEALRAAKLLVAAPGMYAAIRALLDNITPETVAQAKEAIKNL